MKKKWIMMAAFGILCSSCQTKNAVQITAQPTETPWMVPQELEEFENRHILNEKIRTADPNSLSAVDKQFRTKYNNYGDAYLRDSQESYAREIVLAQTEQGRSDYANSRLSFQVLDVFVTDDVTETAVDFDLYNGDYFQLNYFGDQADENGNLNDEYVFLCINTRWTNVGEEYLGPIMSWPYMVEPLLMNENGELYWRKDENSHANYVSEQIACTYTFTACPAFSRYLDIGESIEPQYIFIIKKAALKEYRTVIKLVQDSDEMLCRDYKLEDIYLFDVTNLVKRYFE